MFRTSARKITTVPAMILGAAVLAPGSAAAQTQDGSFVAINDATGGQAPFTPGRASSYPVRALVSGKTGVIRSVRVTVIQIHHTRPDDLDLLLVGPNGAAVVLLSDAGESNAIVDKTITFDDAGAVAPDSGPLSAGTYRPTNNYGGLGEPVDEAFAGAPAPPSVRKPTLRQAFAGSDPNGYWSLYALDDRPGERASSSATSRST